MKYFKSFIVLDIILISSAFLYFYKLDSMPSGLYVDEALSGYNAYSILETGRDEYSKLFPIAFRFFGSYSPPLFTYLTSLSVFKFGLTIFATRFVSVICGLLMIVVIYVFLLNLKILKSYYSPVLGTVIFAISPWPFFYSRTGYELYLGFLLFSLGTLLLFLSFKKPVNIIFGLIILSISTYGAHAERFLVPLFIVLYLILFKKHINIYKKYIKIGLFSAFVIQIPNFYLLATPAFWSKNNLFYSDKIISQAHKIIFLPDIISIPLSFVREFLSYYLAYYSPRSLFFLPDPDPQRSLPELSTFYPWMIIPYLFGLYVLFRNIKKIEVKYIILLLIITPIPASLSGDPFSTQRALPLLLPIFLIITIGLDKIIIKTKSIVIIPTFIMLFLFSSILLWRSYFVLLPSERAKTWGYGFSQLADEIIKHPNEKFVIDQTRIKPAYIELAFYLKYPPSEFHKSINNNITNNYYTDIIFETYYNFANIETRNVMWEEDVYDKQILVGDEFTISPFQAEEHFLEKVFEIRDPIDQIVFVGYRTNPEMKCEETNNISEFCNISATIKQ